MRPCFIAIIAFSALTWASPSQAQTLTFLGAPDFDVDVDNSLAPWTQGPSSITINGTYSLSQGVGGGFLSEGLPVTYDWSGVQDFALTMSFSGGNPSAALFSLEFFAIVDSEVESVGRFEGSTEGLTSTPTLVTLQEAFRGDLSSVAGMQFTLDGDGTINTTISNITAVPEPSTWAMLFFGAALFGGFALRRRFAIVRRQA